MLTWQQIVTRLSHQLSSRGFTITHALPVQLFNSHGCPAEHHLPTFERSSTLGVIIGNTNELWPQFIQHLAADPDRLIMSNNPFDDFVEAAVGAALEHCCCEPEVTAASAPSHATAQHTSSAAAAETNPSVSMSGEPVSGSYRPSTSSTGCCPEYTVRFSHHTEPGRFVNMMRAAQVSGLAYYSSTTHLCMHPEYGPWFALRAVAVFDAEGPDPAGFHPLPCPKPDLEAAAAQQMRQLEALGGFSNWQQHWRDWAALRSLGGKYTDAKFAYSPDQLEYHYTKSKDVLRRAVDALQQQQEQQQEPAAVQSFS